MKFVPNRRFIFWLSGLIACATAFCDVFDLTPFEVTGSRIQDDASLNQVVSNGRQELSIQGEPGLWDVFGSLSSIQVEQAAGLGGNASIYVRGGEPNSAKVLVDGMDVGNIMDIRGGSYNFSGIGLNAVEQIRFLPGSRSAIHGTDALSGVISISTLPSDWENQPTRGEANLHAGNGGLFEAGVKQGIRMQQSYFQAAASHATEDDWFPGSDFDAQRINLGMVSRVGNNTQLRLSGLGASIERTHYPDDSGGPLFAMRDDLDSHESDQFGFSLQTVSVLNADVSLNTTAYFYRFEEFVDSPGVAPGERDPFGVPPNQVENHLDRYQVGMHLVQQLSEAVSIVYGLSYLDEEGDSWSTVVYPFATIEGSYSQSVSTSSAFTETAWQALEFLRLKGAVRYDDIADIDTILTGRLETVFMMPDGKSQLSISWGNGFKKPTFFALGNPVVGNPDLLPEESDLYELTLRTTIPGQGIYLSGSVFRQEYDNLIDFSEAPPPQMVNLNEVVSEGVSVRLEMKPAEQTSLSLDVTYIELEVIDSEELLRNRPKWRAGFVIQQILTDRLTARLAGHYVGSRFDSSIPTGTRQLDAYFRLDAGMNWDILPDMQVGIYADNLLDERYEELIGFVSPGIRIRATLRLNW